MPSVAKTEMNNNLIEAGSHFTELKAVQVARMSTFAIALVTTVLVLYDQFHALLSRVEVNIHGMFALPF